VIGERAGTCKFMRKGRMDTGTPIFWGSLRELSELIFFTVWKYVIGISLTGGCHHSH
jgi:hypothetical protein